MLSNREIARRETPGLVQSQRNGKVSSTQRLRRLPDSLFQPPEHAPCVFPETAGVPSSGTKKPAMLLPQEPCCAMEKHPVQERADVAPSLTDRAADQTHCAGLVNQGATPPTQ